MQCMSWPLRRVIGPCWLSQRSWPSGGRQCADQHQEMLHSFLSQVFHKIQILHDYQRCALRLRLSEAWLTQWPFSNNGDELWEKKCWKRSLKVNLKTDCIPPWIAQNITSTDKLIDLQIMKCIHKWSTKALWWWYHNLSSVSDKAGAIMAAPLIQITF